jgi:hypothetical protein
VRRCRLQVKLLTPTTNDVHCNYGALIELHDQGDGSPPYTTFSHFAHYPGLSTGRAAVLYDKPSNLYWLVSHTTRDGIMPWNADSSSE